MWGYLLAMGPLLFLILSLGWGGGPLFERVISRAQRGQVPTISFVPSGMLWLEVGATILFLTLAFLVLRIWARYFLSRKMLLSYLFFAFIPLATAILIFLTITKVMLGISSLLTFEDAMDRRSGELIAYARDLRAAFPDDATEDLAAIDRAIATVPKPDENLDIQVLWTDKQTGSSRVVAPIYPEQSGFYHENTPEFEEYWPSWLEESQWCGIIDIDGTLCIRNFLRDEDLVVIVTQSIDARFLSTLPGFQVVQVTLENNTGTCHLTTANTNTSWWRKLPILAPFSSRWDSGSFDWRSGYFESYGQITFGLELSNLSAVLENTGQQPFFYAGQKLSAVKLIVGIILIVLLCVLVALVFGGYLVSYITRSLNLLADGHEQIAQGQLSFRLPYIGRDQLGAMGTSFNDMVGSIDKLMSEVAEKEKYHQELRIARDIQMSLLPKVEALGWASNIAAHCIPAHDVGGDYYELVRTETGEIGIFIADVSGKGTSAAFYMAELKGVLIALRHLWHDPHQLMYALNEIMGTTLSANVFISAAYLLIDPLTRQAQLARAGHCPAFHIKTCGNVCELSPPGMAIGIAPNKVFGRILKTLTFPFEETDKVLLYTDGLDEMTRDHELYGVGRLRRVLCEHAELGVDGLKSAILDDVLGFLSSGTQNDDLTLVVAGFPAPVREPVPVSAR